MFSRGVYTYVDENQSIKGRYKLIFCLYVCFGTTHQTDLRGLPLLPDIERLPLPSHAHTQRLLDVITADVASASRAARSSKLKNGGGGTGGYWVCPFFVACLLATAGWMKVPCSLLDRLRKAREMYIRVMLVVAVLCALSIQNVFYCC